MFIKISIYHILIVKALEKPKFFDENYQNFSHGSQTCFKICGITCEIYNTNFIKVKNHLNFAKVYLNFLLHNYK
jgi:hypothetical protein